MALIWKKNQKEEGSARASPVAAPMPKFLSERKERFLRLLSIGVSLRMSLRMSLRRNQRTFHRWGGHVFIVDARPVG